MPFKSIAAKEDFLRLAKDANQMPRKMMYFEHDRGFFAALFLRAESPACLIGVAAREAGYRGNFLTQRMYDAIRDQWGLTHEEQHWLSGMFENTLPGTPDLANYIERRIGVRGECASR